VVNGKGKVDRNLWIDQTEINFLKSWIKERPQADHSLIFCTLKGGKINNRYVRAMLERTGKKARIGRRVHPHLLRHTCLTDLYKDTKDIRLIQKVAGHADLSTTMLYTHIHDEQVKDAMMGLRKK
jgi:integrase/recombinase XerD